MVINQENLERVEVKSGIIKLEIHRCMTVLHLIPVICVNCAIN